MKFSIRPKERVVIDEDDPFSDIAQTERIGLGDFIIAAIIGIAVWTLLSLWKLPVIYPSMWEDVAVANGLRPASHVVGGYFVAFGTFIFRTFGQETGITILKTLGSAALTGIAIVSYAALREMLAFVMRARPQRSTRRSLVMQIASIVGTFAFVAAEPVWRAGHFSSETTILIALLMFALEFFFVFLRKGTLKYAYLCALSLGLLAADSPIAFAFLAGFIVVNNIVLKVLPILESPFFKPAVMAVSKWYMTFIFALGIAIGVGVNCAGFVFNHGLDVVGGSMGALPLMYMKGYAAVVTSAASPAGWLLWFGVCFAPFIVTIIRFPSGADEERFLSYAAGIVFLVCGAAAFSQVAPVSVFWFWSHFPVHSEFLLATGLLWTATTMAAAVTILGVDSLCRNHARLAKQIYGQDEDAEKLGDDPSLGSPLSTAIRRTVVVAIPAAMILAILPNRMETKTRTALGIVKDALAETVREAGDAEYIFTDGNLDAGIELESFLQGGHLKCLPLVSRTANSARDIYLRTRGMQGDSEDLFSFRIDVGMGLRSWIRDRPKRLEKCAVQMGFDLWKRDGKAMPPMGGMLSRPAGWPSEEERVASIAAANALSQRILDLYRMDGKLAGKVKDALLSVQWRLSRMCTYRGEQADLRGDAKTAISEAEMAKRLNSLNETYNQVLLAMSKRNDQMMRQLTSREGLQLALVRADFAMGKMYAETILGAEPLNPDANFAMGMYYVKERQLTRAEEYLKRCLIQRPNEPAIYNNLAMLQMELGKLDAAELNATKALKLIPDATAVQDTLRQIKAAREAQQGKKQDPQAAK